MNREGRSYDRATVVPCPLGKLGTVLAEIANQDHRDNRLLAALPPEALAMLDRDLKHVSLSQGQVVYEPGAPVDRIYFPRSGLISLLVVTRNGNTIEATTVGREGAVGLHGALGKRRSFTRATTQIGGTFSNIPALRFEQILNSSAPVRDLISRYTEVLWAEAQQIAACNAAHDANSRLCRWLLQTADRTGSDNLPLTQDYLAEMVGVRRTTITLLAGAMQLKGFIRYRRGRIVILDRKGLETCVCECYHVLHHDNLPLMIGVTLSK
jgi:CRP-like cAMP-binding protein